MILYVFQYTTAPGQAVSSLPILQHKQDLIYIAITLHVHSKASRIRNPIFEPLIVRFVIEESDELI